VALGGMAKKIYIKLLIGILNDCKQQAFAGISDGGWHASVRKQSFQKGFGWFSVLMNLLRSFCDNPLDSKAARLL